MRTFGAGLIALLVPLVPLAGQTPPGASTPSVPSARIEPEVPVPVHRDPHHRQLFQYGPMRILELQLPPGDRSWFHLHEWPVLYVTLSSSQLRTEERGAPPQLIQAGDDPATAARGRATLGGGAGSAAPAGRAGGAARGGGGRGGGSPRATSTTSYAERPVVHVIENVGTALVRAVVVVNETRGDTTTSESQAGFAGTPELTNGWFRAYRLTLPPGQRSGAHRHRAPVVLVQATGGKGVGNGAMSFEFNDPGAWAFYDANVEHEVHNTGTGTLELIEVELRRPPDGP